MNGRAWLWLALGLALWGPVWLGWAEWWSGRPEQAHGWLVPVFALWLGWERWRDASEPGAGGGWLAAVGLAGALGLWTAGLVLLTPNAYWPTAQWLAGLGAAGGWLAAAAGAGGRRWAGHFAGAALFPLCAAAWPAMVQAPVLEFLSPLLASGAAELVNAGGRLAMAQGSVIEVAGGWVGVDEACAGLRSLDAAVMMAWFIGEQRRLAWAGRLWLGAAALAVAVGGNFLRATALVWVAAGEGPQATAAWHDALGWAVLGLTLAGVLAAAERVERKAARPAAGRGGGRAGGAGFRGGGAGAGGGGLVGDGGVVFAGWIHGGAGGVGVGGGGRGVAEGSSAAGHRHDAGRDALGGVAGRGRGVARAGVCDRVGGGRGGGGERVCPWSGALSAGHRTAARGGDGGGGGGGGGADPGAGGGALRGRGGEDSACVVRAVGRGGGAHGGARGGRGVAGGDAAGRGEGAAARRVFGAGGLGGGGAGGRCGGGAVGGGVGAAVAEAGGVRRRGLGCWWILTQRTRRSAKKRGGPGWMISRSWDERSRVGVDV
jgi:exosortase